MAARSLIVSLALGLILAGCAARPDSDAASGPKLGYYECRQGSTVYVVASVASLVRVEEGRPLAKSISTLGPRGEVLILESDSAGLDQLLLEEYRLRHRVTR